jgi:RNA polymerase sigma factor (sigma-70 family)
MKPANDCDARAAAVPMERPPADGAGDCTCADQQVQRSDAELVAGCLRGDGKCWEALVQRYQRLVYTIVRRMDMDEHTAADVFQAVFTQLLSHLPRIADPARLQAWIVTTAKREALSQRRRGQRTISMTTDQPEDAEGSEWNVADEALLAPELLELVQQLDLVRRGLDQLDSRCRRLLDLLFNDDDTPAGYAEIAASLNMAVGSIGATRARCLAKLRELIAP